MALKTRSSVVRAALALAVGFSPVAGGPLTGTAWAQANRQAGPDSVADLAESLLDAVVNISTSQNVKSDDKAPIPQVPEGSPFQDFFDEFFKGEGGEGGNQGQTVNSLG